jgi:hypothetical protein
METLGSISAGNLLMNQASVSRDTVSELTNIEISFSLYAAITTSSGRVPWVSLLKAGPPINKYPPAAAHNTAAPPRAPQHRSENGISLTYKSSVFRRSSTLIPWWAAIRLRMPESVPVLIG